MPCYQVNTVSVEWANQSTRILSQIGAIEISENKWAIGVGANRVIIDLVTHKARGAQAAINAVKRKYSEHVVKSLAKSKGWQVKEVGKGVYQAVKY